MNRFAQLCVVCVGLLTLAASPVSAQRREAQARLQNASRIDCTFDQIATGDWTDEGSEFAVDVSTFSLAFFDIDLESGTAEAEGRFGASFIVVRYAEGYLHFMQPLNSGPLYLTTVLAEPTEDGRFQAVHTRHEYTEVSLPGWTSRPEMYLGYCSIDQDQASED